MKTSSFSSLPTPVGIFPEGAEVKSLFPLEVITQWPLPSPTDAREAAMQAFCKAIVVATRGAGGRGHFAVVGQKFTSIPGGRLKDGSHGFWGQMNGQLVWRVGSDEDDG